MRIRCTALQPTVEQRQLLHSVIDPSRLDYDLELSREYIAIGVGFWDNVPWAQIVTDGGWVLAVPLFLFEVIEPSASRFWEVRADDAGLRLQPSCLYEPTFNSRLADDDGDAIEEFTRVRRLIEEEAIEIVRTRVGLR